MVKTTRTLLAYEHRCSENLPCNIQKEMTNMIAKYNEQFLNSHPEKSGLVTRVTLQSI